MNCQVVVHTYNGVKIRCSKNASSEIYHTLTTKEGSFEIGAYYCEDHIIEVVEKLKIIGRHEA